MLYSGDCHEYLGADHAFEGDDHVFERDGLEFPDDQCFCGSVSDVVGDTNIPKICLRAKNE